MQRSLLKPPQWLLVLIVATCLGLAGRSASAQLAPGIGYMFLPGGQAGQSVDVVLGGYDWTPDMQLFVHDPRIQLEVLGPPSEVIVPEPPYWFGKKARRPPFLLPRETRARLTIPPGVPPGIVRWQVANANGASSAGQFLVVDHPLLEEQAARQSPVRSSQLPLSIAGQILRIEEVDAYEFQSERTELVTCAIDAKTIGSPLNAVVEIYDAHNRLVTDSADTSGNDTAISFLAAAGEVYHIRVYDLDFRGNRSFVYRLALSAGPRVVAVLPAAVSAGETRTLSVVGWGVATGRAELETIETQVRVPDSPDTDRAELPLSLPEGRSSTFAVPFSNIPEYREADLAVDTPLPSLPLAVTGVLESRYGTDRFRLVGRQGETWSLDLQSERIGSKLDVSLRIEDAAGASLATADDLPQSTDAALDFVVPQDGDYTIVIADQSGASGRADAVYRLVARPADPGFTLTAPELLGLPIGKTVGLSLKVNRTTGFTAPLSVSINGLPAGVTVGDDLMIPEGKSELKIDFSASDQAAAVADLLTIQVAALNADDSESSPAGLPQHAARVLLATTLEPPFTIDAEGKDDVTKWPRGSTFPAPVLIERAEGFTGDIVLEMTSKQGRHRQGISGPELRVPPGATRVLYPVFLPEWLETTRTSRMVVNGVAQVADPQGNLRYVISKQKTRMGFLPTGALMTVSADTPEIEVRRGQEVICGLTVRRAPRLTEPIRFECTDGAGVFDGAPVLTDDASGRPALIGRVKSDVEPGAYPVRVQATVLQEEKYPVRSEAELMIVVRP